MATAGKTRMEKLFEKVKAQTRRHLGEAVVADVDVAPDVDFEGDEVIRVIVIFRSDADPSAVSERFMSLTSRLREVLEKGGETRYPLVMPAWQDEAA